MDENENVISDSRIEAPEKNVTIHCKAFSVVSYDPMAKIVDDDEYSSIRSTPAPGEN